MTKRTRSASIPTEHDDLEQLLENVRNLVVASRKTVARGVDLVQVHTCFQIGRHIVEFEQSGDARAPYGKEVIPTLADRLTVEFGRGFSKTNIKYMRRFFLLYQDRIPICQSGTGQLGGPADPSTPIPEESTIRQFGTGQFDLRPFSLGWTHYVFLMGINDPDERKFYEIEADAQGWNLDELKRQYNASLYERLALSRDPEGIRQLANQGQVVSKPRDLLKEPLVLEFLGLEERARYSETELEGAIINRIEHFLLELGKGFLFEARQKRFSFDDEHFFVDLVFYNRLLRCYVLVDLKIGKLTHQDLGQMQMYVNAFDRQVKLEDENPTIGIILCKRRNESLVEITLPREANIHAREYQLYLPSKEELRMKLEEWTRGTDQPNP